MTLDASGNLYGTTEVGGVHLQGAVFELANGAHTISTLYSFSGIDGSLPTGGVTLGRDGSLYGTTDSGGTGGLHHSGAGTVFRFTPSTNTLTTLVNFNISDGAGPLSGVTLDGNGNIFGTTAEGGHGIGTVYEIAAGTEAFTTLVKFDTTAGGNPIGAVAIDSHGNLFGAANFGGGGNDYGTVYEVSAGTNTLSTLATFDGADGANPDGSLLLDSQGNLFGTATHGGAFGNGSVYEVAAGSGVITTLASFNGTNGAVPESSLILDRQGDLFGTTSGGGANNDGTVFEIPSGSNTIDTLVDFDGGDGVNPGLTLSMDSNGDLFGTTSQGGVNNDGTIFELERVTVPESGTLALFALALPVCCLIRRRISQ